MLPNLVDFRDELRSALFENLGYKSTLKNVNLHPKLYFANGCNSDGYIPTLEMLCNIVYNYINEQKGCCVKRRDLEKLLRQNGWRQIDDNKHAKWTDGKHIELIPKHKEINENLAKAIIKRWNLK